MKLAGILGIIVVIFGLIYFLGMKQSNEQIEESMATVAEIEVLIDEAKAENGH